MNRNDYNNSSGDKLSIIHCSLKYCTRLARVLAYNSARCFMKNGCRYLSLFHRVLLGRLFSARLDAGSRNVRRVALRSVRRADDELQSRDRLRRQLRRFPEPDLPLPGSQGKGWHLWTGLCCFHFTVGAVPTGTIDVILRIFLVVQS